MEFFGALIIIILVLFFLASPFLVINLFQQLKNTKIRIDKLSETVNELSNSIARIGKETTQTGISKEAEKAEAIESKPAVTPPPTKTIAATIPAEPETRIAAPPASECSKAG